jgi:predicted transglutaminase-like cysteine proteinase
VRNICNISAAFWIALCATADIASAATATEAGRLSIGTPAPRPIAFETGPAHFDWGAVFDSATADDTPEPHRTALVTLDDRLRQQVEDLNIAVNSLHHDSHARRIDCVGYVQRKRAALVAAGLPADTLSAAIVITPGGISHTVLVMATDHGDLVLDNLTPYILPWRQTDYTWIELEITGADPGSQSHWAWIARPSTQFAHGAASR